MGKSIAVTGIKPTGDIHLGNYLGAIRPALELMDSGSYDSYYFIADYHGLTTMHEPAVLKQRVYEIAAAWLALGLDPKKARIYRQSDLPQILELNWILACFASKGLLNRAHAYKALTAKNVEEGRDEDEGINMGLFTYPILMSADILIVEADVVPVGADQVQHIEIARDIAQCLNSVYQSKERKELIKLPKALVNKDVGTIIGLDGQKMSKSYNNVIPLFVPEKNLQKIINRIVTDSTPPEAPKDPNTSLIYTLYGHFATAEEKVALAQDYHKGISWGAAKAELFRVVNRSLSEPRERFNELMANPKKIETILEAGLESVKPRADQLIARLKDAVGFYGYR